MRDSHDDDTARERGDEPTTTTEQLPGAVRHEREIDAPIEEAWTLLRDDEGLQRWLADEVDLVVEPGGEGTMRDGDELREVLVEDVEPGRHVGLRWWPADAPDDAAFVDLTLDDLGDGRTRIVVTELPLRVVATPDLVPASWTSAPEGPSMRDSAGSATAHGGSTVASVRSLALA